MELRSEDVTVQVSMNCMLQGTCIHVVSQRVLLCSMVSRDLNNSRKQCYNYGTCIYMYCMCVYKVPFKQLSFFAKLCFAFSYTLDPYLLHNYMYMYNSFLIPYCVCSHGGYVH